jgi:hypothetical protein
VIIGVGMIKNKNGMKYLNFIRCPPNHAITSLSRIANLFSAWTLRR